MEYTHIISAVPEGEHFDASAVNEGVWLSVGHLDGIENALSSNASALQAEKDLVEAANAAAEKANGELATANETIASKDATIAAKDQEIATLQEEVAKLKAAPAGSFSSTNQDKDDIGAGKNIISDPVNAEAARLRAMKNGN